MNFTYVCARRAIVEADLVADLGARSGVPISLATRAATLVAAMRRGCVTPISLLDAASHRERDLGELRRLPGARRARDDDDGMLVDGRGDVARRARRSAARAGSAGASSCRGGERATRRACGASFSTWRARGPFRASIHGCRTRSEPLLSETIAGWGRRPQSASGRAPSPRTLRPCAFHDGRSPHRRPEDSAEVVVAPDYRLAPEDPCPADIDDLVAVDEALATRPPAPPLAIVGLSAGGGAALAALMRLRDAGKPLPKRAVLLSPMVDATGTSPSWSSNAGVDWPAPADGRRFAALYAGERPLTDPEVSPVNGRLEGLPPTLVIVGDAELLRDDAFALADRATAAGVALALHVEPDMVHAFMTLGRKGPSNRARACPHPRVSHVLAAQVTRVVPRGRWPPGLPRCILSGCDATDTTSRADRTGCASFAGGRAILLAGRGSFSGSSQAVPCARPSREPPSTEFEPSVSRWSPRPRYGRLPSPWPRTRSTRTESRRRRLRRGLAPSRRPAIQRKMSRVVDCVRSSRGKARPIRTLHLETQPRPLPIRLRLLPSRAQPVRCAPRRTAFRTSTSSSTRRAGAPCARGPSSG